MKIKKIQCRTIQKIVIKPRSTKLKKTNQTEEEK